MFGITRQEAELLGTFNLILKMKNHQKTVQHFTRKFHEDPDNPENAFNYGLCMSIYMMVDKNDQKKLKYLMDINHAFGKCLAHNPDWWLVRYLCSELNEEIRRDDDTAPSLMPEQILKNARPDDDREILIRRQQQETEKPSYFFVPYISQARAFIRSGDFDAALQSYNDGLQAVPIKPSPYCFFYLTRPLYDTVVYIRKMGKDSLADQLKKDALTIFPKGGNLCMT